MNTATIVAIAMLLVLGTASAYLFGGSRYLKMLGDDPLIGLSCRLQAKEYAAADRIEYTLNNKPVTWWQWWFVQKDMRKLAEAGYTFMPSYFTESHERLFGPEFDQKVMAYHLLMKVWRNKRGGRPNPMRRPKAPYHYCQYSYTSPSRRWRRVSETGQTQQLAK